MAHKKQEETLITTGVSVLLASGVRCAGVRSDLRTSRPMLVKQCHAVIFLNFVHGFFFYKKAVMQFL
jgi:G:T-mismatch repair DNA endonuclease (very short patch repair protein)